MYFPFFPPLPKNPAERAATSWAILLGFACAAPVIVILDRIGFGTLLETVGGTYADFLTAVVLLVIIFGVAFLAFPLMHRFRLRVGESRTNTFLLTVGFFLFVILAWVCALYFSAPKNM